MPSPSVKVQLNDQSQYAATSPTSVPLFFVATRKNKQTPSGGGIALGTAEAGVLRAVTSRREVVQTLGVPAFVTANGAPVHGHETNEYGLHALWSFMDTAPLAYYVRADIDLGGLLPKTVEPTRAVADGTYWLEKDAVVGGFFRRNAANTAWVAVPSAVYTVAPGNSDGAVGDIAFDYSTTAGTVKIKTTSTTWVALGGLNLSSTSINTQTATTASVWKSDTAPTGAGANDYWWKTSKDAGGYNLKLKKYRALDDTWVDVVPLRSTIEPASKAATVVWEDLSAFDTNGSHPLKVGNGTAFVALTTILNNDAPTMSAATGDLWYSDDITDFALYVEATNKWVACATVTSASPAANEKVISASAPATPSTGALWVDISGSNLANFPVIKRWNSVSWEDITGSVSMGGYVAPTLVQDGSFWINLDDTATKCTVKEYDPTYEPVHIDSVSGVKAAFDAETHGRWKPVAGSRFLRAAQRFMTVKAIQEAIANTENLRSQHINYQIMVAPGYPEAYDEMVSLNAAIGDRAHIIPDVPFTMVPAGVTTGREITVTEWKANARGASETGELGFVSAGTPFASAYYPHGLSTNADGQVVFVPSSTMMVRTIVKSDSDSAVYHAPMGLQNGTITNATSVGYLTDAGVFKVVNLSPGQSGILYDNQINPIENLYRVGLRNMGNKNLYGETSMLSKTNVGRLVSQMKFDMQQDFRQFLGMQHHPETWGAVRNLATRYMTGLVASNAVSDFIIVVDENNNDDDAQAAGELFVDVAFVPIGAVEFITVRLKIENPGDL